MDKYNNSWDGGCEYVRCLLVNMYATWKYVLLFLLSCNEFDDQAYSFLANTPITSTAFNQL